MSPARTVGIVVVLSALAFGFGIRRGGQPQNANNGDNGPDNGGDPSGPVFCTDGKDCRSGVCTGGQCVAASSCTDHADCPAGQYCHFGPTYTPGTSGSCEGPCASNADCGFSQECVRGRCYTNMDCDPANVSCDCPPGEVCNRQSRLCSAPPTTCYFNEQCPCGEDGWFCNTNQTCIDSGIIARCTKDSDCDDTPGCDLGCVCFDGGCIPEGQCDPTGDIVAQCGAGNYCAGGTCRPATACTDQEKCTPYGLLCDGGYCINPPPCHQPDNTCDDQDLVCQTHLNPPVCLPPGTGCAGRDELCPAGKYCEPFTGTCQEGCRDDRGGLCNDPNQTTCQKDTDCLAVGGTTCDLSDGDCTDFCPGASWCGPACDGETACYCNGAHACTDTPVVIPGDTCTSDEECASGTTCVFTDKWAIAGCGEIWQPSCDKSCRVVCDPFLVALGLQSCPAEETCGGGDSEFEQLLLAWLRDQAGGDNAMVCY